MALNLLSLKDAAAFLGMEPGELRQMAVCGEIPCVQQGERMLFEYGELDTWFTKRLVRHEPVKLCEAPVVSLSSLCSVETMDCALPGKTKSAVLKSLTALAERSGLLYDPKEFEDELRKREEIGSTAMAEGVALVHPNRRDEYICEGPFVAIARSERPVFFGEADGIPTDIFFVVSSPDNLEHLHILARVCEILLKSNLLTALREAQSPEEMLAAVQAAEGVKTEE